MKLEDFMRLKVEDEVIDSKGNRVRVFDIHKGLKLIRAYGDSWRSYVSFQLPKRRSRQ